MPSYSTNNKSSPIISTADSSPVLPLTPRTNLRPRLAVKVEQNSGADEDESDDDFDLSPRRVRSADKKESLIELLRSEPPAYILQQQQSPRRANKNDNISRMSQSPTRTRSFFSGKLKLGNRSGSFGRKQSLPMTPPASAFIRHDEDEELYSTLSQAPALRYSKSVVSFGDKSGVQMVSRERLLPPIPLFESPFQFSRNNNISVSTFGAQQAKLITKDACKPGVDTTKDLVAFFRGENVHDSTATATLDSSVTSSDASRSLHSRDDSKSSSTSSSFGSLRSNALQNVLTATRKHIRRRTSIIAGSNTPSAEVTESERQRRRQSLFSASVDEFECESYACQRRLSNNADDAKFEENEELDELIQGAPTVTQSATCDPTRAPSHLDPGDRAARP
ncbi:hypothetical protein OIO90_004148 [Microbotryomycetes sp. JL221]|nr:hypothetical protein OIO90_004148 [Microbotryomycetes sp. JL221]